ncbi:hypothetical protein Cch01nite_18610 [Cellulomonas chitinilytica]|uniref:DUF3558 domain-containing protein n=1 Tax=Cellulomonas chitinilytica TaxID=398759 RepID=A0A919P2X2_9CELL|nr:hypothetical protein Cch01nite_18610 [Cellulomonas chitinilytica]
MAALLLCVVSGCTTPPDLTPVPTVAPSPFICAGVSADSANLILGGEVKAVGPATSNPSFPYFECDITRSDGSGGQIRVIGLPAQNVGESDEAILAYMGGADVTSTITADAPGRGFSSYDSNEIDTVAGALWICDEFALRVRLQDVDVEGRDAETDSVNLLRSMLPWACGGEKVPPASF